MGKEEMVYPSAVIFHTDGKRTVLSLNRMTEFFLSRAVYLYFIAVGQPEFNVRQLRVDGYAVDGFFDGVRIRDGFGCDEL